MAGGTLVTIQGSGFGTAQGSGSVEFGGLPATDAEIIVSYNVTEYAQIGDGDSAWPYTVAWDQGDGGVPMPQPPESTW